MRLDRGNVVAVARREYMARGRTRTFKLTTLLLVVIGVAAALSPLIFRYLDEGAGQTTIEVSVGNSNPGVDVVATLGAVLNAGPGTGASAGTGSGGTGSGGTPAADAKPKYRIVATDDVAGARARILADESDGLLVVGAIAFRRRPDVRVRLEARRRSTASSQLVYQASATIATQDRLATARHPAGRAGEPVRAAEVLRLPRRPERPADPRRQHRRRVRDRVRARDPAVHGDRAVRPVDRVLASRRRRAAA